MASIWEVVGGADKGGILVREGESVSSAQLPERISTGALVEELKLVGERLHYRRLTGTGPTEGWVSIKLPGKDLMIKTNKVPSTPEEPMEASEPTEAADRSTEAAERPAEVLGSGASAPTGTDDGSLGASAVARCEKELARSPISWTPISIETVQEGHQKRAPGMFYGFEFPWTAAMLEEFGPDWLTEVFHAAGTLDSGNKVTKIVLEEKIKVTTGNNGGKFLFEVEYAEQAPGLHTRLFAKIPFPLEGVTKSDRLSSSVNKQPQEFAEINTYRLLEHILPCKIPKYYYGDISTESTNWILITERVDFADFGGMNFGKPAGKPKPLQPFQIEGPYDKCIDYNLRGDAKEYYMLLVRTGGMMAGLYKAGKMGSRESLNAAFQNSEGMPAENYGMKPGSSTGEGTKVVKAKLDGAITFITEVGKVLFPKYATAEKFHKKFTTTMMTLTAYSAELTYWKNSNPDYVALAHQNLNVDNAYFWRNEECGLELGIFDWGGMSSTSVGHKLWWWLYCGDFEPFKRNLSKYIEAFIASYKEHGGPELDKDQLHSMTLITAMEQMMGLVSAVPQIYKMCPKKEWATIKDRYDLRISENIDGKSTLRLYLHVMNTVIRIIEEMKGDQVLEKWINEVYVKQFGQTRKTDTVIFGA